MILKVKSTGNSWILIDNLENVTIHQFRYPPAYIDAFENLYLYILDDDIKMDDTFKIALISAQRGSDHLHIAFNTQAFLMSDSGKTVERIIAERGTLLEGLCPEKHEAGPEMVTYRDALKEAEQRLGGLQVAVQDLLIFLKINPYQLEDMANEVEGPHSPDIAIPHKIAAKLLPYV